MSSSAELQLLATNKLGEPGALPAPGYLWPTDGTPLCPAGAVPILARRTKDLRAEIEAAAANHGLCIYVQPPMPTQAELGVPFVFFSGAELRVSIFEKPPINMTGVDAYDLIDAVALALHWQPFEMLSHPLYLARRPVEIEPHPDVRIFHVVFGAVYALQAAAIGTPEGEAIDVGGDTFISQ